ncbi:MAG: Major facilitator superfamily 1 transporter [Burkholderiaceae bacterium]|nr:Major facilitator superfamily 1 transporter [Burkholderiaceae bacterium]
MPSYHKKIIFASSLGTAFEWYDFYLYGTLASILGRHFLSGYNPTADFIVTLMLFAVGFVVRPFGALFFGRLGDMVGRKHTFLVTILIMGLSTFIIGLLPTYESIGVAAPIILIALRLLQGLALGGEYGGAATYVAEHAPAGQLGRYTGWVQLTASLGLFFSLMVTAGVRGLIGEDAFAAWGWRIPFLASMLLLGFSIWLRMQLDESPLFVQLKADGLVTAQPLRDSFARWSNLRKVLAMMLGLCAGQGVIWYTSHFYALFFLTQSLKLPTQQAQFLMILALILAMPTFIFFASLSDKIGRRPIMITGCILSAILFIPLFKGLGYSVNPALQSAQERAPVVVFADPARCSFQFNLLNTTGRNVQSCDIAKAFLSQSGVAYSNEAAPAGMVAQIQVGREVVEAYEGGQLDARQNSVLFKRNVTAALERAGYPLKADVARVNQPMVVFLLWVLLVLAAMVYGPMVALLVDIFPTRIRYTSMSLPYHIGNGWFGGILPTLAFAMVAATGDVYFGLWYPIGIAFFAAVIALLVYLPKSEVGKEV